MLELKRRFEELEKLPAPDLALRIQARVERLAQPDHVVTRAEQAMLQQKSPWPRQLLAAAALILFAIGLGIALLQARSHSRVLVHPSPSAAPQPSPTPSIVGVYPPGFYPGSLHMLSPTIAWNGWSYYQTLDGGLHWRVVSTPPPSPDYGKWGCLNGFALDSTHAWLAGQTPRGGVVCRTVDGGRTWTTSAPLPATLGVLGTGSSMQLDFIDAQRGWLYAGTVELPQNPTPNFRVIFATSDGGLHWRQIASAGESDANLGRVAAGCRPTGMTFISADSGWLTYEGFCSRTVAVATQYSGPVVAVTRDGGRSWDAVVLPSYPSGSGWSCSASPPVFTANDGVLPVRCDDVIGHSAWIGTYSTADGGRTWTLHKLPFLTMQLDFIDAHTGWAVKQTFPDPPVGVDCLLVTCPAEAELFGTTDGGITWRRLSRLVPVVGALGFFDAKVGYYGWSRGPSMSERRPGGVMKSTDGGRTWSLVHPVLDGQG